MSRRRGILLTLLALSATAALCFAMARYDNKYTHAAAQPDSGVLTLSENALAENPVRYLARGWRFYPGKLLSPGDRSADFRYLDVGGLSVLPGERGSYGLTLLLPDAPGEYALELPEVYMACRLYINGALKQELGDLETGEAALGSRLVLFTASGRTELLLSVRSGGAGYGGGTTHPPAFGTADGVAALRQARLTLHSFFALLMLLLILLAASFGWRGSRRRGLLAMTGALCALAAVGRPLLCSFFTLNYQPWAAVEVACRYGILLTAVLLQLDVYGLWRKNGLLLALPSALGLAAAVICSACASVLPEGLLPLFSAVSAVLKLYSAALLVGVSAWVLLRAQKYSALLLCGSVAMAVCLVFDRLFPLYEPILGGWYPEIGAVLLTAAFAAALWMDAISAYLFRLAYGKQQALLTREIAMQREHYLQLSKQIELSRQASHDLRHHLRVLKTMADQGDTAKISAYLTDYGGRLAPGEVTTYSNHLVADAVLCHYAAEAERVGADCDLRLSVPAELDFPDDELCILLGNLLENAVAAIAAQQTGRRTLYLRGDAEEGRLGLVVDNSFDGALRERNGVFLSTKHEGPGLGLASVRAVAAKHDGLADFSAAGGVFHAELMIPLPHGSL